MRRIVVSLSATLAALALAGTAAATTCSVVKKPLTAGEKLFVDLTTGAVTPLSPAAAHAQAGFATLDFDGDGTGDASTFYFPVTPALEDEEGIGLGSLPSGAHNAGPGASECDGKGVDDLAACG